MERKVTFNQNAGSLGLGSPKYHPRGFCSAMEVFKEKIGK